MAPFIDFLVVRDAYFAILSGGNDGLYTALMQGAAQMIGVKGLIAEKSVKAQVLNQRRHSDDFAALTGQQAEADQIAKGVHQGQNLGGQSAFRASDGLIESPPFAPLAF